MKGNRICDKVITLIFLSVLFGVISCNKKEAPQAPKNLTAVAYDDHIQLSWDKVSNADYYSITVGFQKRNQNNFCDGEIYSVSLGDTPNVSFADVFPFEGVNYYKVQAVNDYGTSSSSEVSCYYSNPLNDSINSGNGQGVLENMNGVVLYPNPSDKAVCIGSDKTITQIVVENYEGQLVLDNSCQGDAVNINTAELDAGIYLAHVYTEAGEVVMRFVVAHD